MAGFIFPIAAIILYAFEVFNIELKQLLAIIMVYMISLTVVFIYAMYTDNKKLNEENNPAQIDLATNSTASPDIEMSMMAEISVVLIITTLFLSVFGFSYFNKEINISFLQYMIISVSIGMSVIIAIGNKIIIHRKNNQLNNQLNNQQVTSDEKIPNIGNPMAGDFNKKLKQHNINLNKDI